MTDSPQPQITKSTCKDIASRFKSGTQHPRWTGSSDPRLEGKQFGLVRIISPHIHRKDGYRMVECQCTRCQTVKLISLDNLTSGKSNGCQSCSQKLSNSSSVLGSRYDALKRRCTSPNDPHYKHYGGRGITCNFASRAEFILYVEQHLPHPDYKGVEIDRIDNNGHYEPGNLHLATRTGNNRNRRVSTTIQWQGKSIPLAEFPSPYAYAMTYRYATQGMAGEQIINRAWQSVAEKRKGWRQIQARLMSMTSSTPGPTADSQ